jgi:hypothetical protein
VPSDAPGIADLQLLQQRRQALINQNLMRANCKRVSHDCQPGDEVPTLTCKPDNLEPQAAGLFTIHAVHTNGAATVNHNPCVSKRLNVRVRGPAANSRSHTNVLSSWEVPSVPCFLFLLLFQGS